MKVYVVVLLLLCMDRTTSYAQQYFNKRDALHSFFSIPNSVVQSNGRYYCTADSWDSVNYIGNGLATNINGVEFAVFNKNGDKLSQKVYQNPYRQITTSSNNLQRLGDGSFLLAGDDVDTGGHLRLILIDFDSLGNMIWNREYDKPFCAGTYQDFFRLVDFKKISTGWLMLATMKCGATPAVQQHDFLLTKLDQNFDVVWNKQLGDGLNDIAGKLLIEPDGYTIAGDHDNLNHANNHFKIQAELMKVDTSGSIIWTWYSDPTKLTNQIMDVIKMPDGGYVYCGQGNGKEIVINVSTSTIYFKPWIERIDVNRNVVWNDTVGPIYTNIATSQLQVLKTLANGNLIVAGQVAGGFGINDTMDRNYGILMQYKINGQKVWQKKYQHADDTLIYMVHDMKITDDGGFIMAGEATDQYYPQVAPIQQAWLVKVDSNGCQSLNDPQCWPVAVPKEPTEQFASFRVYPNPAKDVLEVSYTKAPPGTFIELQDLLGRVLSKVAISGISGHQGITLYGLPSGVYLYRIQGLGGIMMQGKIIKE